MSINATDSFSNLPPDLFNRLIKPYKTKDLNQADIDNLVTSVSRFTFSNALNTRDEFKDFLLKYFTDLMKDRDNHDIDKIQRAARFCVKNRFRIDTDIELNKKIIKNTKLIEKLKKSNFLEIYNKLSELNPEDPCDKQTLIELAKMAAVKDPHNISLHIKNFKLDPKDPDSRNALIKITEMAAREPHHLCKNIQNFGFDPKDPESREALNEIAQIVAAVNAFTIYEIYESLKKTFFDPKDPESRKIFIDIAKLSAATDPYRTCEHIQNFGFDPKDMESRQALIEIIKVAVEEDPTPVCRYIKNFGFDPKDPKLLQALIEVAKIVIENDPEILCESIIKFGLDPKDPDSRKALIEIAKTVAAQSGSVISQNINKFGLNPQEDTEARQGLMEILQIACNQNAIETFALIYNYKLEFNSKEDKIVLEKLLNLVFIELVTMLQGSELIELINCTLLESCSQDRYNFSIAYANNDLGEMERLVNKALSQIEGLKPLANLEGLSKRNRLNALVLLRYTLFKFEDISNSDSENLLSILKEIFSIPQPRLRFHLINRLHEVISDPSKKATFFASQDRSKSSFSPPLIYFILAGMDTEALKAVDSFLAHRPFKKDGELRRFTLDSLESLFQLSGLDLGTKRWLINELLKEPPRHLKKTMRLLKTIATIGQGKGLSQKELEEWNETSLLARLEKQFSVYFKSLIPISSENQDLYEKYEQMIGQFRDESALLQYMSGSIKKLLDEEQTALQKTYAEFIDSLLSGNFRDWRYSTETNPHLKEVFKDNAQLEEAWKKGSIKEIGSGDGSGVGALNFKKLMNNSLNDVHFNRSQFPELVDYIESQDESIKKDLARQLKEEIDRLSEHEIERFSFTMKAIDLMNKPDQNERLNLLNNLLKLKLATGQFKKDIEDWIKMLEQTKPQKTNKALKVVEGDDPCDLLMCGTEVLGSCQSIYGDPSLNRCLLGYIANGQNRLIAVKNSEGKIVARALFRLLIKEGSPVLFLERFYPENIREQEKKAIYATAIEKAEMMGLPLYEAKMKELYLYESDESDESDENDEFNTKGKIQSLGGQSLYDYVDASDGVAKNSVYAIKNYSPISSVILN